MAIYGAPSIHIMSSLSRAMHVHVLGRHVHCINHTEIVMSWARLCWFLAFTRYSTLCVCWIGVCRLFDVLISCVVTCKGILCVGGASGE